MKHVKKYIAGWAMCMLGFAAAAQTPLDSLTKNYYTFEQLTWYNPWLQGNNAAGLVFNSAAFEKTTGYSVFQGTAKYEEGDYRNIYAPASQQNYGLQATSYMKLNKIYLYGNFIYDYNFKKNVQWFGMLDPYSSPFMLADSVPGNYTLEQFHIDAGAAVPLGNKWTAGLYADYTVAGGAKHRDLRNKNTYMNLLLRPSIMFHSEQLNIGANFTYERKTEKIEYTQIETNTSKTIFSLYGLWFYTSEVYASGGDNSRQKDDNTFGGAAQVELLFGDFKFYNEFTGLYKKGTQSETGYNNKQFGDIEQTMYRYDGALSYNNAHRLKGYVAFSKMLGYKLLQRSELSPDAALYLWITYNRINSYVRNATNYEISYTFHRARTAWNNSWELSAGARGYNVGNAYMMYPLKYSQTWNYTEAFASFNKNLRWKTGMIDIFPTVAYGVGSGTENEVTQYDDSNILEPDVPWQLNAQLAAEYAFMTADRLNAGLKVRYSYFLNKTKGWDIYGDLCYNYTQALSGTLKNNHRQNVSLTVGFSF